MPTSTINGYVTPSSLAQAVTHEHLYALVKQMQQGDVMRFASEAERTAAFAALAVSPPIGSVSSLINRGVLERWNGTAWVGLLPSANGINNATGVTTTTSATYVDVPATSSFSFTKTIESATVRIDLTIALFSTTNTAECRIGARINGVDYDVFNRTLSAIDAWATLSGSVRVPSIPVGVYTVQARFRRVSGTGTLVTNANGWISMHAMEVM